jgi:hypothetical protein
LNGGCADDPHDVALPLARPAWGASYEIARAGMASRPWSDPIDRATKSG